MMNFHQKQQQQQQRQEEQEEESVLFLPRASKEVELLSHSTAAAAAAAAHAAHPNKENNHPVNMMNPNMMRDDRQATMEILTAVALPNTIRPPVIPSTVHPSVLLAKRLGILCSGFFLALITYIDAYVFFTLNIFHRVSAQLAGIFWAFSCLSLLLGSVWGCYHGKWRYLAPGIVLSHLASVWINLVMEVDT
jgi:hypothetical protein